MTLAILRMVKRPEQSATDQGGERTYSDAWRVQVNENLNVRPLHVRAAALATNRIPLIYPDDLSAKLTSINVKQLAKRYWDLDCGYSTRKEDQATEEDPLAMRPKWSGGALQATEFVTEDINGDPILNTADDPYDPIELPIWQPDLRVEWNAASFSYPTMMEYRRAVNSDPYKGFNPGEMRCSGVTWEENFIINTIYPLGLLYYKLVATFDLSDKTFKLKIPSKGFYYWVKKKDTEDEYVRVRIMAPEPTADEAEKQETGDAQIETKKWTPKETPSFLNEDGTKVLAEDEPLYVQEFDAYNAVPFSAFFPA